MYGLICMDGEQGDDNSGKLQNFRGKPLNAESAMFHLLFINTLNNTDPNTDSCGMPLLISFHLDNCLFILPVDFLSFT